MVVWIFALLTAAIHIRVFAWEALLLKRPAIHHRIFGVPTEEVPAVRLWAFGVGFYNLFLACGLIIGVLAWWMGQVVVGRTLVTYLCWVLFLAGIVLFIADRTGMGRETRQGRRRGDRPVHAATDRAHRTAACLRIPETQSQPVGALGQRIDLDSRLVTVESA